MQLDEGKEKFILAWGKLALEWGVNKTMGQVHALLLVSHSPLSCEDIMKHLKISRGNANTTIRALQDWGIVYKHNIVGDRKDYFIGEKDVWQVFTHILLKRKQKELDPMIKMLQSVSTVEGKCEASDEFCKIIRDLKHFSTKADSMLETILRSKGNMLLGGFMRMGK